MTQVITSMNDLAQLYGEPGAATMAKDIDYLNGHYQQLIEKSPFVVIATIGEKGIDCSPRGDPAGFVKILDNKTLLIPDRRGNNRLDTLKNLINDSRISLFFMIPGVGETFRVKGEAELSIDPEYINQFKMNGKLPTCIIKVHIHHAYYQCQKALARSKLWDPNTWIDRSELPTAGEMLKEFAARDFDQQAYDKEYPARMKKTLY